MIEPIRIKLVNFKCFSGELIFEYPREAGLYFVAGQNQVHEELEGNGCGKSTLFCDAPCWVLYGKTPRGLRANDVIHWKESSCLVEFTFKLKNKEYTVKRTQSPNSLLVSVDQGKFKVLTQVELDSILEIDYAGFCSTVVFGQLAQMFFDLRPGEKAEMMDKILSLEVWDKAIDLTKQKMTQIQAEITQITEKNSKNLGKLQVIREQLGLIDVQHQDWLVQQQRELKQLEESRVNLTADSQHIKQEGKKLEEKKAQLLAVVTESKELVDELLTDYNKITTEIGKLDGKSTSCSALKVKLLQEIERLSKLGRICVTCKQKIDENHVHSEQDVKKQEIVEVDREFSTLKQQYQRLKSQLTESGELTNEAKQFLAQKQAELSTLDSKITQLKYSLSRNLTDLKDLDQQQQRLLTKTNPFVAMKENLQAEKEKIDALVAQTKVKLDELAVLLQGYTYWVGGFKDVKMMLIDEVLLQLEVDVNSYLYQFGLWDWKINFEIESETKSGKAKRKNFNVFITSPNHAHPIPWDAWSGGEIQRLRLAGSLGMADLILASFGFGPGMEVYDEPSNYLSSRGIHDLIATLRDRALQTARTIFLIDHRNLDSTQFTGLYTVCNRANGVYVTSE